MNHTNKEVWYAGKSSRVIESLNSIASDLPVIPVILENRYDLEAYARSGSPDAVFLDLDLSEEEHVINAMRQIGASPFPPEIAVVGRPTRSVPEPIRVRTSIIIDTEGDVDTQILRFILPLLSLSGIERQLVIMSRSISRDGDTATFRAIAENLDDLAWILDADENRLVYINPSVYHHTGYSVDECLSPMCEDITRLPAGIIFSDITGKYKQSNNSRFFEFTTEVPSRNKNGVRLRITGRFFTNGKQGKTFIAALARNIDEKNPFTRGSESDTAKTLFSYSPIATIIFDEGMIVYANKAAADMITGTAPDDLIGKSATSLFRETDRRQIIGIHDEILSGGKFNHIHDIVLKRTDGAEIRTDIITTRLDRNGKPCVAVFANEHAGGTDVEQREERLFISAVEHAPDAVILLTDETIVYLNQSARTLFKVRNKSEIIGHSIYDFISAEDRSRTKARFDSYLNKGKRPPKEEFTYLAVDGSTIHIEVNSLPFEYGTKPATLAFFKDITPRRKAEAALIKSASHIEAVYRSTPTAIGLVSSDVICEANNQIFEMTEYAPDEIIGSSFSKLFTTDGEYRRARKLLIRSNGSETSEHFESAFRKKDGTVINILMRGTHFPQSDNDCTYIFSALDITSRKITEMRLARRESELNAIYESSPFIILLVDSSFTIRRANKAALDFAQLERFTENLKPEDIVRCGKYSRNSCDADNTRCEMRRILRETLDNGATFNRKEISVDNGNSDPLKHSSMLVSSLMTEISGERMILLCIEDITEKKRLNETIRQMQKLDTIGKLAGGIAHDFNNVLSGLTLHISLLMQDETLPEQIRRAFVKINDNIQRGVNLTRKLLLFGRRETMRFSRVEINLLLSDLVKLLSRILGGNVVIDFIPSDRELIISGDAGMIELAVINLCINARDAMPEGGRITISPGITVTRKPDSIHAEPGPFVKICLEDNGIGLSDEARARLFDPFFTTKPADFGTGLGLSVVYGIIKNHHGWIHTESEKGKGTRFDIFIPEHNE